MSPPSDDVLPEQLVRSISPGTPVGDLAQRLVDAGHMCFVVGGSVRDALLGVDHTDLDCATDARPEVVAELLAGFADAVWLQGQRFGTVGFTRAGARIEVTTFRAEVYRPESRKPYVDYSTSIDTDLSRRDFTVNAMAVSVPDLELVDPFGGAEDLRERILRTPLSPRLSFTDDPLRMLRAARFVAAYRLRPDSAVVDAIGELKNRIEIVSGERIRDELTKLLLADDPRPGLELLLLTGLLAEFLPEQVGIAHLADVAADPVLRLAVLLAGADATAVRSRLRALRFPSETVDGVARTVALVEAARRTEDWNDERLRRFVVNAGERRGDAVGVLAALGEAGELVSGLQRLARLEDLDDLGAPLDGATVMAHLGIEAGPKVGEALAYLLEQRIRTGPIDSERARRLLDDWSTRTAE